MSDFLSKKITRVSFILAICIILYHTTNTSVYAYETFNPFRILQEFISNIIDVAVPTFFVISGFLYYHNCDTLSKGVDKAKKRVNTLLIPYLIFCAIYTIYFLTLYNLPGLRDKFNNSAEGKLTFGNLLQGLLLAKYSGILWYVRNLLYLTALCPLIFYSLKNKPLSYGVLGGLFVLFILNFNLPYVEFASWFWYYLGAVLATTIKDVKKVETKYSYIGLLCGLIFAGILTILEGGFFDINQSLWIYKILAKIILCIMIVSFWFALDLAVTQKSIRIEKISFFIYCTHSLILETIQKTLFIIGNKRVIFGYIDYFLSPILTFAIIIALAYSLSLVLPKVFKVISGGRVLPLKKESVSPCENSSSQLVTEPIQEEEVCCKPQEEQDLENNQN